MCIAGGTRRKSLRLFLMSLRHRWMAGESISTILFSPSLPLLERASPCSLGRVFVVGRAPKRVSLRIIRIRVHTRSPTATQKIKSREICASSIPLERFVSLPQKSKRRHKNHRRCPSSSSSAAFPSNKSLFRQQALI